MARTTGVSRKIDDLGRIVLPAEIRRRFGLTEGTHVEIQVEDNHIVLSKVEDSCVFCGVTDDLRPFRERRVCAGCIAQLSGMPAPSS